MIASTRWAARRWTTALALGSVVLASVVACGDDAHDASPEVTSATTASTTAPTSEPDAAVAPGSDPLVLVTMGHSLLVSPSPGVQGLYRDMLQSDFEVTVELRDHTRGGQRTDDFLARLRNDDELRRDLAEADVVLVLIPNGEWADTGRQAMQTGVGGAIGCGGPDGLKCFRDTITAYEAMVDEVFVELMALVDPSETLVRITDFYVMTPGTADEAVIERLGPLWHQAQLHVAATAAQYGLPVAPVFDDFMGPDGTRRPEGEGLVANDGIHPTAAGAARMAELVHELGYDLAE